MEEIKEKLDRIILLLERLQPTDSWYSATVCICDKHKLGESTVGWDCPVHGKCY